MMLNWREEIGVLKMEKRIKIMFVFGTRPEAIKMVPVIKQFEKSSAVFDTVVVSTAQHRHMLDGVLELFSIVPDYDLNVMRNGQSIENVTLKSLKKLSTIIKREKPHMVLVQGDTTTTLVGALAGFYNKIPIGHIEAGLRSFDKHQPFPEEINRRLTTVLADLHFAPTKVAWKHLKDDGIDASNIFVTGNTVIDTLLEVANKKVEFKGMLKNMTSSRDKIILVTAHRRENFGSPLESICCALKKLRKNIDNVRIIFPVHPNPCVKKTVEKYLGNTKGVYLLPPVDYVTFVHLMKRAYIIMTDSGGVQEEGPSLGKPVLVLRNKTERGEAVEAGVVKLIGTDVEKIVEESTKLMGNKVEYDRMARRLNPYGDGHASKRIYKIIYQRCMCGV